MILPVKERDPLIYEPVEKFDFANPPVDPIELAKNLAETVIATNALGLSANQCGLPYRAFVIRSEEIIACFNPNIVDFSSERQYLEEGCLSFRNLYIRIRRPSEIRVRYTEPNGNVVTRKFGGLTARIFQHELDHLNGITMLQQANPIHLERALKNKKIADRRQRIVR